ncbi:MAG: phosphodiester glycosidase family protein [Clostridiaceae bacterium]|nr:phosphodiester glycosidase family protein [Clostridiaceae bacterium]
MSLNDEKPCDSGENREKTPEEIDAIVRDIYISAVYGISTKPEQDKLAGDANDATMVWKPKEEPEKTTEKAAGDALLNVGDLKTVNQGISEVKQPEKYESEERPRRRNDQKGERKDKQNAMQRPQTGLKKPLSKKKRLQKLICSVLLLVGLYSLVVFSDIPFIKKWRDIYIETAMGTMTHQWLATSFIPNFVIEKTMSERTDMEQNQENIDTNWSIDALNNADKKIKWSKLKKNFFSLYSEIDEESFNQYLDEHGDDVIDDGYLLIDKAGLDDKDTGIKTIKGDRVIAIDTKNGITIIHIDGADFQGKLAIIKNPAQISLGLSSSFGEVGSIIADIAKQEGAVLAINASGFYDPEGHGNGGMPHGLVISDGETYSNWSGGNNKTIGFDYDDVLNIGKYKDKNHLRDAVEFKPVLVYNGDKAVEGSAGWGISPRSAIGQTVDGQVLLLVVDGRQAGYSIGCTMEDLAEVMLRYGAYQACNLDGGSSSIMYYNGRKITKPSAGDKENGRRLPDAFVVAER